MSATLPLAACQYFFPSDPGPPGPLAVRYENGELQAVLPACAPQPVEAQLRTISTDQAIWIGEKPDHPPGPTFRIADDSWGHVTGAIPDNLEGLAGVEVVLVDGDYRAWTVTIADTPLLLRTGSALDLVLTPYGLKTTSTFRAASCA